MKEIEGFEHAVIAGGFVRDTYFDLPYTDIDIFVPCSSKASMFDRMVKLDPNGTFTLAKNSKGYGSSKFMGKWDGTVDEIPVDIVFYRLQEKETFGSKLLEFFNYGIDMLFTDGKEVHLSKDFQYDLKKGYLRLVNLEKISELPHAMKKYERLKEKYTNWVFTSDYVLEKRKGTGWV